MDKASCAAKDIIAYQGHIDAFKPTLSAREALEFWAGILDKNVDIGALLSKVGLSARGLVPCGQLSAGQKRRLSLARAHIEPKTDMDNGRADRRHGRGRGGAYPRP